jgi:hypothetical protein
MVSPPPNRVKVNRHQLLQAKALTARSDPDHARSQMATVTTTAGVRLVRAVPTLTVHHFREGSPVGSFDGAQRSVGGIAEGEQVGAASVVRDVEQATEQVLVLDRGMTTSDAEVGCGQCHQCGCLAEVESDGSRSLFVVDLGYDQHDRCRGAGDVTGALPDVRELRQHTFVGNQHEVPRLPIAGRGSPTASFEDPFGSKRRLGTVGPCS